MTFKYILLSQIIASVHSLFMVDDPVLKVSYLTRDIQETYLSFKC